ncbi:MAG: hypothetical protein FJ098_17310, partial [Deltaproteobacteria bacterium]|nr:hypothetical protein [Deltaproteobacteria bacterium]
MTQEERVILADPRRSPRSAAAIWVAGAVQVLGGVWILASGVEQSAAARLVLSSLALVSGALFLQVGRILGEEKGGLAWLPGHRILEVGGPARGAALRVPGAVIRAVQVRRRTERWGREEAPVEVASVELSLRGGAAVLLAEAGPEDAADFAGLVRRQTGLPAEPEDTAGEAPAAPPPRGCERLPEGLRARVGPWTPLALPMATTGVLALGVGGLLLADVTREPVFGFLFGPTLAALGLCLLAPLGVRA